MVVYALVIFFLTDNSYFIELNLWKPRTQIGENFLQRVLAFDTEGIGLGDWSGISEAPAGTRLKGGRSGVVPTPCSGPCAHRLLVLDCCWRWQAAAPALTFAYLLFLSGLKLFSFFDLFHETPEKLSKCFLVLIQIRFNSLIANGP